MFDRHYATGFSRAAQPSLAYRGELALAWEGWIGSETELRYHVRMDYQAILAAPFAKLGIRCTDEALLAIEFLPPNIRASPPRSAMAREVGRQIEAYLADAGFHFDLPLKLEGTVHQRKVWQAMRAIPCGQAQTYGELAARIGSSARAVGQACGNNPVPIVIPCHRVVSKSGLGGFMHRADNDALNIKRWLLAHERR